MLVHEGGHFVAAKLSGVQVNEFALGMGPKLFSFTKGETKYSLRLLPIGGYCSMEGEDEESDNPRAFGNKPTWKRIIIVVAGAVMNIVLGLLMTLTLVLQQPYYASTTISSFPEKSVTVNYLQEGDKLEEIDGYAIWNSRDISFAIGTCKNYEPNIKVSRNGQTVDLGNVPLYTYDSDGEKKIALDFYVDKVDKNFFSVCEQTIGQTVSTVRMVWASLVGLVTGKFGFNDMSGPVGVASAITTVASQGLETGFLDGLTVHKLEVKYSLYVALVEVLLCIFAYMVNVSIFKGLRLCCCQYLCSVGSGEELAAVVQQLQSVPVAWVV